MARSRSSARLRADSRYCGSSAVRRAPRVARAGSAISAQAATTRPTTTAARTGRLMPESSVRGTWQRRLAKPPSEREECLTMFLVAAQRLRVPAPVVMLLPAHNEEATVADVVRRAPGAIAGHPVQVLVVDDGSTDATAPAA